MRRLIFVEALSTDSALVVEVPHPEEEEHEKNNIRNENVL